MARRIGNLFRIPPPPPAFLENQKPRCAAGEYGRVRQPLSLRLLDAAGRDLWLEVRYKKEEKLVVQTLERLTGRLTRRPEDTPVFFGSLYREGDRLKLYPIEVFTQWEVQP